MKLIRQLKGLTKFEFGLWLASVLVVTVSFFISGDTEILNLIASLVGVTSVIYISKGYVLGEIINIIFSILYGIVSIKFRYYGEMMSYLLMAIPMSLIAIVSWFKHPYKDSDEVKVGKVTKFHIIMMSISSIVVTILFYFILKYFNTANLIISTISIFTSFVAAYLTYLRSEYYAVAYGLNDIVLIVLWILASIENISYLPIVFCFVMFLANDTYGFINWLIMKNRQKE